MIGNVIVDKEGIPLDNGGQKLSPSALFLPVEVRKFFAHFQRDYLTAWSLQRKPLDEFDGMSLLDRAKIDQENFAALVGVEYFSIH